MRGVGQTRWQCYRRHPHNPQPCPNSVVLAGKKKNRGKGEKKREEYAKPRTRRKRQSYWNIGLTTMAATQEHLSGMALVLLKKKNSSAYGTVYYLNRDNRVPNCPNSYAPLNAERPSIQ